MSFWNTSSGHQVEAKKELDQDTSMEPIPDGSVLKCAATEAKIEEHEGEKKIKIRWDVLDGEYKGRVVFHNIKAYDADAKKRDKAIEMLAAIDAITGGGLMASGEEPTDMALMKNIANKPVVIRVRVWEMDGKTGNWVDGVWDKGAGQAKAPTTSGPSGVAINPNDDIGF